MKGMWCIVCFLTSNLERFQTLHNIFCIYFGNSTLKQSTGLPTTLNQQAALFIFAFHFCKQTPSCAALNTERICCALVAPWCPELWEGSGEGISLLFLPWASWTGAGSRRGHQPGVGMGQPRGFWKTCSWPFSHVGSPRMAPAGSLQSTVC